VVSDSVPSLPPQILPESRPAPSAAPASSPRHLVVVTTRQVHPDDEAGPSAILVTRFWHPHDHRWSENFFESLDHAIRLFVDESGWTLLQQQHLQGEHDHELIFQARSEDFTGPSTREILADVGLTPRDVEKLLDGSS
jgi:hypothetical protein